MKRRWLAPALAALLASGCDLLEPGEADRVPGRYRLATYGGQALPAVIAGDAAGNRVELRSAELELRRNFRWVLVQRVESVAGGARTPAVLADSGIFRFNTVPGEIFVTTPDGRPHPANLRGADTVDVFWSYQRHDVFVR
ncbi:MAG TPA: hypothetical protein VGB24_07250 [Longimicrobium sp.]|jgi:hypothetical protein|uniref:hypothetical protein n=1 Tax=Longimicrobium sp. TaxID=2029185 RepID=UPI002ED966BE